MFLLSIHPLHCFCTHQRLHRLTGEVGARKKVVNSDPWPSRRYQTTKSTYRLAGAQNQYSQAHRFTVIWRQVEAEREQDDRTEWGWWEGKALTTLPRLQSTDTTAFSCSIKVVLTTRSCPMNVPGGPASSKAYGLPFHHIQLVKVQEKWTGKCRDNQAHCAKQLLYIGTMLKAYPESAADIKGHIEAVVKFITVSG
ncbi:hypothetical protein OH76DRAFT_1422935 [Lentinus brumalis]|uniref:Uncharacterized protein n=1 Tax=Lentinus brumalis TaxID=2498619 RepID=A0A371CNB0_9APHY|nr:hypothetical protein OH76DRAFT_1422935 [Polyporus brumalis]